MVEDASDLLEMIRPAQDSKFGDYQANCAMPMKNLVGKSPRQIADEIISKLQIDDLCQSVEVAGPGFINLTLDDNWLKAKLTDSLQDPRLGIKPVQTPGTSCNCTSLLLLCRRYHYFVPLWLWARAIGARAHDVQVAVRFAIHAGRIAALKFTATAIGDPHGVVGGEATEVRSVLAVVS